MGEKMLRNCWANYVGAQQAAKERTLDQFLDVFIVWWHRECDIFHSVSDQRHEVKKPAFPPASLIEFLVGVGNILSHVFHAEVLEIGGMMHGDEDVEPIRQYFFEEKRGTKLLAVISKVILLTNYLFSSKEETAKLLVEIIFIVSKLENDHLAMEDEVRLLSDYVKGDVDNKETINIRPVKDSFKTTSQINFDSKVLTPRQLKAFVKGQVLGPRSKRSSKHKRNSEPRSLDSDDDEFSSHHDHTFGLLSTTEFAGSGAGDFDQYQVTASSHSLAEPLEQDIIDNARLEVNNLQVSVKCVCYFVLEVLNETAYFEQNVCCLSTAQLSSYNKPSVSQNALDILSPLLDELVTNFKEKPYLKNVVKQMSLLMFTCASTLACSSSGVHQLERLNLIEKTLRVARALREQDDEFWVDILMGSLQILVAIAQYLPVTRENASIVRLIRVLMSVAGRELVDMLVHLEASPRFEEVVNVIGQLIFSVQRSKVLAMHREMCQKKKHTKCNVKQLTYHHSDILGSQVSHSTFLRYPLCCVSALTLLLSSCLANLTRESEMSIIIKVLSTCGLCCCSSYTRIYEELLEQTSKVADVEVKKQILKVIEIMWLNKSKSLNCCKKDESSTNQAKLGDNSGSDSAIHSDISLVGSSNVQAKPCAFGVHYRSLMQSDSLMARHAVVKHLWSLSQIDCATLTWCLYQHIVLPLFLSPGLSPECLEYSLLLLCEIVKTSAVSKHFIGIGGFSRLCLLLTKQQTSQLVIGAVETILMNELKFTDSSAGLEEHPILTAFWTSVQESSQKLTELIRTSSKTRGEMSRDFDTTRSDSSSPELEVHTQKQLLDSLKRSVAMWEINSRLCYFYKDYAEATKNSFLATEGYNLLVCSLNSLSKCDDGMARELFSDVEVSENFFEVVNLTLAASLRFVPIIRNSAVTIEEDDVIDLMISRLSVSEITLNSDILEILLNCSLAVPEREKWTRLGLNNTFMLRIGKKTLGAHADSFSMLDDNEADCDDCDYDADDEWCFGTNTSTRSKSSPTPSSGVESGSSEIVHPSVCSAVVEILSEFCGRVGESRQFDKKFLAVLKKCLKKMTFMCEEDAANPMALEKNRLGTLVLDKFRRILTLSSEDLREAQQAILDLFLAISYHCINGKELKEFFGLFKSEQAPWALLLSCLNKLLSESKNLSDPMHCLVFPAEPLLTSQIQESLTDTKKSWILNSKSFAINDGTCLGWTEAALMIPFYHKSTQTNGGNQRHLTASFWLSASYVDFRGASGRSRRTGHGAVGRPTTSFSSHDKFSGQNKGLALVHICSFAIGECTFEAWLNTEDGKFTLRHTLATENKTSVLSEFQTGAHLTFVGLWHHLTVCLDENSSQKSSSNTTFSLSIDGSVAESIVVDDVPNVQNSNSTEQPMGVLLGTTKSSNVMTKMSNFHLFQGHLTDAQRIFLYFNGFQFGTFTENCFRENCSTTLPPFATDHDCILNTFMKADTKQIVRKLRSSILLSYPCDERGLAIMYKQNEQPTSTFRILTRTFTTAKATSDITTVQIVKMSNLTVSVNRGIRNAIAELGGIDAMIFLFGKTVDQVPENDEIQAEALQALFRVKDIHQQFEESLKQIDGYAMINAVLESSKCSPSERLLAVYLNSCITSNNHREALIRSSKEFEAFYAAWRAWHRIKNGSGLVYRIICDLLHEDNPWREINLFQMKKGHILQAILNMLQVSFHQGDEKLESLMMAEDASMVANAVTLLIGFPADLSALSELTDCLILLHKATKSFVCFSRSSAYFLFPSNFDLSFGQPRTDDSQAVVAGSPGSDDWQVISSDTEHCPESEAHAVVFSQLIAALRKVIVRASPEQRNRIIGCVLKLDYFMVWINSESYHVREEAAKALLTILKLCQREIVLDFIGHHGFHLIGNQLKSYPATYELFTSFFSFLLENEICNLCLDDIDLQRDWSQMNSAQASAFIPVFSLLVSSAKNVSICHDALQNVNKILEQIPYSSPALKFLFDNGIGECLANILFEGELSRTNSFDDEENFVFIDDLICEDSFNLLSTMSYSLFNSSGGIFFEAYNDLLDLFLSLKMSTTGRIAALLQECVVIIFKAGFDCIEKHTVEAKNIPKKTFSLISGVNESEIFNYFVPQTQDVCLSVPNNAAEHLFTQEDSSQDFADGLGRANLRVFLSWNEAAVRFRVLVNRAVDFVVFREMWEKEKLFSRTLIDFLTTALKEVNEPSKSQLSSLYLPVKDCIKKKWSELLLYHLSSEQRSTERKFIASKLESFIVGLSSQISDNLSNLVEIFIEDMHKNSLMTSENRVDLSRLIRNRKNRRSWSKEMQAKELNSWASKLAKGRDVYCNINLTKVEASLARLNGLYDKVRTEAMEVTRTVIEAQNKERSQYLHNLKETNRQSYATRKSWKSLIQSLTHERAVWYDAARFPQSWQLDATEGPSRIRRRLKRCHLTIAPKFFLEESKNRSRVPPPPMPLNYLFKSNRFETDSSAMIDHINTNERITFITPASVVTPKEEFSGELLIGNFSVHFVGQQQRSGQDASSSLVKESWLFKEIKEVEERRYQLKNNAIELFLTNGSSYLIAFRSVNDRQEFLTALLNCPLPNVVDAKSLLSVTQMWRERTITNFDYLMYLNKAAGRSFNDLMQYPVFPFVLSDYQSESLDFRSGNCFRDLSKPMAIQEKSREQLYINQFNYLKNEFTRVPPREVFMPVMAPFHYGSHYSNSGTVLHFLVRLPPFTQMFINYQDQNFDIPDRTFHSMQTTWKLASGGSTTDFKELTPEFFYLPEFLQNIEQFNFGARQHNGLMVDHVSLPRWCRGDPRLFVFINRQALESTHVTEHLHDWIDLVFGYKQSGKAAEEAINVFHPATYFGVEVDTVEDPLRRKALETMIKTFGQMPRQLFTKPHASVSVKHESEGHVPVTGEINGLRWGTYVGSPSEAEPSLLFRSNSLSRIESLVPLATNEVFGLPAHSCLIVSYSKPKKPNLPNDVYITNAAIVTWNHPDGVIRIKHQREQPSSPFLGLNTGLDTVTVCTAVPDCGLFLVAFKSGSIGVYSFQEPVKMTGQLSQPLTWLYGHDGPVTSIAINREFRTVISCGADGTCISWDLNSFCYIRTIARHDHPIDVCCVSSTLGDIATSSSDGDEESCLMCHTINGNLISIFKTEATITALAYSACPEGISVNILVTGFNDGSIRLWSSWDLTPVHVLKTENFSRPVKCLAFSVDNNYIYAVNDEGTIVIFGKSHGKNSHPTPVTLF